MYEPLLSEFVINYMFSAIVGLLYIYDYMS